MENLVQKAITQDEQTSVSASLGSLRAVAGANQIKATAAAVRRMNTVAVKRRTFVTKALELFRQHKKYLPPDISEEQVEVDAQVYELTRGWLDDLMQIVGDITLLNQGAGSELYGEMLAFHKSAKHSAKRGDSTAKGIAKILDECAPRTGPVKKGKADDIYSPYSGGSTAE